MTRPSINVIPSLLPRRTIAWRWEGCTNVTHGRSRTTTDKPAGGAETRVSQESRRTDRREAFGQANILIDWKTNMMKACRTKYTALKTVHTSMHTCRQTGRHGSRGGGGRNAAGAPPARLLLFFHTPTFCHWTTVGWKPSFVSSLSPIRGFFAFKHAAIQIVVDRGGGDLPMTKCMLRLGEAVLPSQPNSLLSSWRC